MFIMGLLLWILADVAPLAHMRLDSTYTIDKARGAHTLYTILGYVCFVAGWVEAYGKWRN